MPTTSNFGWTTPADTDLVKDGAAAIRTLGNGIDTSLLDLKGGTSGQVLSKNSNTDLDYTWVTPNVGDITEVQAGVGISVASGTGPIPVITNSSTDLITTAGDLLYGTAADTVARLGIGTANQVLAVNSGATAPQWVTPAGALTVSQITTGTLSGASVTISSLTAYDDIIGFVKGITLNGNDSLGFRINANATSPNYKTWQAYEIQGTNYPTNYTQNTDMFKTNDQLKSSSSSNNFWWHLTNCKASGLTMVEFLYTYEKSTSVFVTQWGKGIFDVAAAVSSIRFLTGGGQSFTAGDYEIYGG